MTIAACYFSHEGVVLGADSTTTTFVTGPTPEVAGAIHHFNFAQKIFQIGEGETTLGITMWGLGTLGDTSYRTLIAQFGDDLRASPPADMAEVARRWGEIFWVKYEAYLGDLRGQLVALSTKPDRTEEETRVLLNSLQNLSGGFCVAGRCAKDRSPSAFEVAYSPISETPLKPAELQRGGTRFWGCPNLIERLLFGVDSGIFDAVIKSGKWAGTQDDLFNLLRPHFLGQPVELPIREAIDWVHASIYATIKTMKFSHMAPVCGGPIEVAVITTDRPFRWVIHKELKEAVAHDGFTHA